MAAILSFKLRLLLFAVAIAAVSIGGFWLGRSAVQGSVSPAGLTTDPAAWDFGTAWLQTDFPWTIELKNTSQTPIEVVEIRASCGCTSVEPAALVIPPGEKSPVTLHIDFTKAVRFREPEQSSADIQISVTPIIPGETGNSHLWILRGTLRRALASPEGIGVESVEGQPSLAGPEPTSIPILIPVESVDVTCPPGIAAVQSRVDRAGRELLVDITPSASLPVGETTAALSVTVTTPDGTALPAVEIPLMVTVLPRVQSQPSSIVLGMLTPGEPKSELVELVSRSGDTFTVESVTFDDENVEAEEVFSDPRMKHYLVTTRLPAAGDFTATGTFTIAIDGQPEPIEIPVRVSGYGRESIVQSN